MKGRKPTSENVVPLKPEDGQGANFDARAAVKARELRPDVTLPPKFYPVLSSLQRFLVSVVGWAVVVCGAEPFRLRSIAPRRGLSV